MRKNLVCREEIVKKLQEEGIIIPSRFEGILFRNTMKHYGGKMPSLEAVGAVIKICNYWKEYCADENEFSKLVCEKIYTMARIHAAVINSNKPESGGYIGNSCKLKEGVQLPTHTVTIATMEGAALIQKNHAEQLKPL